MASKKQIEERVKTLVAEVLAEEKFEGRRPNINDIEDAMVRIGDMVAREFGVQALAEHNHPPEQACCPNCGQAGEYQETRTRGVITRRGEIPFTEVKFRCPKCRRFFFPADSGAGN
jgi:hypothetical protein